MTHERPVTRTVSANDQASPTEADGVDTAGNAGWVPLFADSIENSNRPTLCLAPDLSVAWANQALADVVDLDLTDLVGRPVSRLIDPDGVKVLSQWWHQATAGAATNWDADFVVRGSSNQPNDQFIQQPAEQPKVMHMFMTALMHDRAPVYLFGGMHDVTQDRDAAVLLARQTSSLESIARGESLSSVLDGLAVTIEANHPGVRCTILLLDERDGRRLYTAAAPSMPASFAEAIDGSLIGPHEGTCGVAAFRAMDVVTNAIASDPDWQKWCVLALELDLHACWSVPIIASGRHGDEGRVLGTFATYFETERGPTDDERHSIARASTLAMMALERDRDEAELRHANLRDPLTGLPNRRHFLDDLGGALRRARRSESRVAVLFLDVDHFKLVNDSMGHLLGDDALRAVADRVSKTIRPNDFAARFGGDEFTICCEDVNDPAEAEELAHQVRAAIEQPIQLSDGREVFLTVSTGVALGSALTAPHSLVADADAAMSQAKAGGRAGVIRFDERMRARSRDRLHIQSALRRAIDRDEFYLVYQPQIDLRTGSMVGVEALLRWTTDELGVVPPDRFIPVAEDSDLIMDIGAWVLEKACTQARNWQQVGNDVLCIAVNASVRQFTQADTFFDTVESVLASSGLEPAQLRIEVTESTLGNPVTAGPLVARLKQLGVTLAIDDFGTGFSSLARLRSFNVDELKIDRSFVEGLEDHPDDRAVVAAIVAMAKALHVDTVGEGVETAGQLEALRELGCDRVQGFYLGRPMAASAITKLLDDHQ